MGFLNVLLRVVAFLPGFISGAESIFGSGTGKTKQESVVSIIGLIFTGAESISRKDIVDNDKFQSGLKKAIDGVVEMLNASIWYKR